MSAKTDAGMDAYDLAMLGAQLLRRRNTVSEAVDEAWALIDAAKHKLEGDQLLAEAEQADAQGSVEKQRTEYLASLKIPYDKGVRIITSYGRRDRARGWFKRFLVAKAEKARAPKEREAWVEAQLVNYEAKGFTGTEVDKLKTEFDQWRARENKAA